MSTKKCKCGAFYTPKFKKQSRCTPCATEYKRAWVAANRQRVQQYRSDWHKQNKIGVRAKQRERLSKPDTAQKMKEYRRAHATKVRETIRSGNASLRRVLTVLVARASASAKGRSKRRSRAFDLTTDLLEQMWHRQQGLCAMSGMKMELVPGHLRTVSVDRIDSDGDYLLRNVQLVCRWVNMAKGAAQNAEMAAVIAELRG